MDMNLVAQAAGVALTTGAYMSYVAGVDGLIGESISLQAGLGAAAGYAAGNVLSQGQSMSVQLVATYGGAVLVPAVMGAGVNPIFAATAYVGSMLGLYVAQKLGSGSKSVAAAY